MSAEVFSSKHSFVPRMAEVEKQFSNQKISWQQFSRSSPNGNNRQIILIEQSSFPYRNKRSFFVIIYRIKISFPANVSWIYMKILIIQASFLLNFPNKNWKTVFLPFKISQRSSLLPLWTDENRIFRKKEGENFCEGRSVILLNDRGRAKVQRSSMMQPSLNERLGERRWCKFH